MGNLSMADLNPLIRVRKHVVEQKQKFLSDLYRQAEDLESQKQKLSEELNTESAKIRDMGASMLSYFGPYAEAVKQRIKGIMAALGKVETRIDVAREDMREAFAELKKVEITQERREDEEQKEIDRKESNDLDEIGIEGYRRRIEEDKS